MNIKKLLISFVLIIIIAGASSFFTISKMNELSVNTQKMYTHPFRVSNAVAEIQTGIMTIHRNMKDIVLTRNSLEIMKIIEEIQHEEDKVLRNYDLIYKYYLGNKKDIDLSYNAFKNWKKIREEVLLNVYENKYQDAVAITKGKGAKHIKNLYKQVAILKDFAFSKANQFYTKSVKHSGVEDVITVIIVTVLVCALIILYVVNTLMKVNHANHKQLYIIDQNILMARMDLEKDITEISNALCRTLDVKREEILNTKNEFFFTNEDQFKKFENIIYSAKEYNEEVYLIINNTRVWFNLEIFPELDDNFKLKSFNIFLTNITDRKKIEEVAIVDSLTGLNNRNYFETIFDKEVRRAKRDKKALGMIMLDIDFFKQYNDTYGHQEGDKALKAVAKVIASHTNRSYDHSFRVGGEEFIVLTYQDSIKKLEKFAQLIIDDIEKLKIPHKTSKCSSSLTTSAGVSMFDKSHLLNTEEMYKVTDDLLYTAKGEGRNRICSKEIS